MEAMLAIVVVMLALATIAKQPKPRPVSDLPLPSDDVRGLIAQGKKIAAIRAYRKQTGATLLEANHVIGRYMP